MFEKKNLFALVISSILSNINGAMVYGPKNPPMYQPIKSNYPIPNYGTPGLNGSYNGNINKGYFNGNVNANGNKGSSAGIGNGNGNGNSLNWNGNINGNGNQGYGIANGGGNANNIINTSPNYEFIDNPYFFEPNPNQGYGNDLSGYGLSNGYNNGNVALIIHDPYNPNKVIYKNMVKNNKQYGNLGNFNGNDSQGYGIANGIGNGNNLINVSGNKNIAGYAGAGNFNGNNNFGSGIANGNGNGNNVVNVGNSGSKIPVYNSKPSNNKYQQPIYYSYPYPW